MHIQAVRRCCYWQALKYASYRQGLHLQAAALRALPSPPLKYPSIISAAICEIFSFKYLCAYTAWKFVLYVVGDVHVSGRVRSVLSRVK